MTFRLFAALACLLVPAGVVAGSVFEEDSLLEVELAGPLDSTLEDLEQRQERRFVLRVDGAEIDVMVRVRGKSRARVCKFPPLRISFPEGLEETVFAGQESLKLVSHCRGDKSGDVNAMEEYMAYRIFNLLSPVSYRVRPLRIRFSDTEKQTADDPRYGFLIEPSSVVAARNDGELIDRKSISLGQLDPQQAALTYVFQYMIGNTDWSLVAAEEEAYCCHNGKLLDIDEAIYYVPYDFDLAGLVNASYAKPDPSLKLRNVRLRRYRGFCSSQQVLLDAVEQAASLKNQVLEIVATTPGLTDRDRKKAAAYLEDFFEKAADSKALAEKFERRCLEP